MSDEKLTIVEEHHAYHPQEVGHADVDNTGGGSASEMTIDVTPTDVDSDDDASSTEE